MVSYLNVILIVGALFSFAQLFVKLDETDRFGASEWFYVSISFLVFAALTRSFSVVGRKDETSR